MRLLNVTSLKFEDFPDKDGRPPYIIASHLWTSDQEISYQGMLDAACTSEPGYAKLKDLSDYIWSNIPWVRYFRVDSCCVNKQEHVELLRFLRCMFEWYEDASECLAYLDDVDDDDAFTNTDRQLRTFRESKWYTSAWTLQPLLAARTLVFLTQGWKVIGYKGSTDDRPVRECCGPQLHREVAEITLIDERFLRNYSESEELTVDEKLKWMDDSRTAVLEEDMTYAMQGIFDVCFVPKYGEGHDEARRRLMAEISWSPAGIFEKMVAWLAQPDQWQYHARFQSRRKDDTSLWLLEDPTYQQWKMNVNRRSDPGEFQHLLVHGPTGCGKTALFATAVDDIAKSFGGDPFVGQAIVYFEPTDEVYSVWRKFVFSLVRQLARKGTGRQLFEKAWMTRQSPEPYMPELEDVLRQTIESFDKVHIHLDGLDAEFTKSSDHGLGPGRSPLQRVLEFARSSRKIKLIVTYRRFPGLEKYVAKKFKVKLLAIPDRYIEQDI